MRSTGWIKWRRLSRCGQAVQIVPVIRLCEEKSAIGKQPDILKDECNDRRRQHAPGIP
jgi:hypothetical protein